MYQAVDVIMNGAKQAIQVIILSKKYEEIATHINTELKAWLYSSGWYRLVYQESSEGHYCLCS